MRERIKEFREDIVVSIQRHISEISKARSTDSEQTLRDKENHLRLIKRGQVIKGAISGITGVPSLVIGAVAVSVPASGNKTEVVVATLVALGASIYSGIKFSNASDAAQAQQKVERIRLGTLVRTVRN